MQHTKQLFIGLLCLLLMVTSVSAQNREVVLPKKSAADLKADFILLRKILEANHPSLYWYTPKDSMDVYFTTGINSITDSMDEVQFKNKVSWVISKIRCGHTVVRFSKSYTRLTKNFTFPVFPLNLKVWGDSMVVLNSLRPRDKVFTRGTVITGINGRSNRELMDTLFQHISADGYGINYKNQLVSTNFPGWYKTILGLDSVYRISYIDSSGKESIATLKNFSPSADTTKRERPLAPVAFAKPTKKQIRQIQLLAKRSMQIDTANSTAFMHIGTFTGNGLRGFFRRSFKTIRKQNLQHLVIDLRDNGGGKVYNSILLTKYLTDHSFKVGDSVVAISRKFKYSRYIRESWTYWFAMNFGSHKMDDGLIHFRKYETQQFEPKERNHFKGDISLVQGGLSFSATTMFIANLKGQKNVTLVGEETGGGYYGNSAMYLPTIVLPHSKLQISLPMYRLVMDSTRPKGHGIMPDIEIAPSSQAIKKGVDLKIQQIRERIQRKPF